MRRASVIIPTYNRGKYVCEAIESVLGQTFQDFEVIVVDDGSTDDTRQRIEHYLPRIEYIHQKNAGPAAARNTGIAASKGEYVAFLDSDDLWLPNKLRLQVEFMDSNPQCGMVFADLCRFKGDQIVCPSFFREREGQDASGDMFNKLISEDFFHFLRHIMYFIVTSTVLLRREVFDKVGTFDESLPVTEDYDMWLRIARRYSIGAMDVCLVKYRVHDASLSWTRATLYMDMLIRILEKQYKALLDQNDTKQKIRGYLAELYFELGYTNFDQGNNRSSRANWLHSLRYGNLSLETPFLILLTLTSPDNTDKIRRLRRNLLARFRRPNLRKSTEENGYG